jgi:hypothetical protein
MSSRILIGRDALPNDGEEDGHDNGAFETFSQDDEEHCSRTGCQLATMPVVEGRKDVAEQAYPIRQTR